LGEAAGKRALAGRGSAIDGNDGMVRMGHDGRTLREARGRTLGNEKVKRHSGASRISAVGSRVLWAAIRSVCSGGL
jgi:hypothetical protein